MRVRPEAIISSLLFALSPCAAQERDPTFELVMALGDADATKGIHAAQKLMRLRKAAVPALLRGLKTARPGSKKAKAVLELLGRLKRDATSALPKLLELVSEEEKLPQEVFQAVARIAPYAPDQIEASIQALGDAWMRRHMIRGRRLSTSFVARSRARLDVHSGMTLGELIEFLEGDNPIHREVAAELIVGAAGEKTKKLVALRDCLKRKPGRGRIRVKFQSAMGSSSISTSINNHAKEQLAVARAIVLLSSTKDVPSEAWIVLLDDEEPDLVRRAILAVGVSPKAAAVPKLIKLANGELRALAWEGITALGMMGALAEPAISTLEQLAKNEKDKGTTARAKAALASIERAIERKSKDG